MSDPFTTLHEHVVATLPDSLSRRRQVLTALHHVLMPEHPAAIKVRAQLAALDALDQLQAELHLEFQRYNQKP